MGFRTATLFYKTEGYFVDSIGFDLLVSESHSLESQVTEHPVESGATVNDHIRILPRKGSLVGMVTNHPLMRGYRDIPDSLKKKIARLAGNQGIIADLAASYSQTAALFGSQREGIQRSDFDGVEEPFNRAQTAYEAFKALWEARKPCIISTGLEKYKDVVVTKVSTDRDKDTGDCLRFSVEFQEIRFVTLAEVALTATTKPLDLTTDANKQGMPKAKKGKTGGTEKPPITVSGTKVVR